ncbi:MAG: hypothetical protein ACR2KP_07795 [Egibacteraceae bacterium]
MIVAPPGEGGFTAVGDGTLSEPCRYLLLCAIPTGADPDEYMTAAKDSEGPPTWPAGLPISSTAWSTPSSSTLDEAHRSRWSLLTHQVRLRRQRDGADVTILGVHARHRLGHLRVRAPRRKKAK